MEVKNLQQLAGHLSENWFITKFRKIFARDEMNDDLLICRRGIRSTRRCCQVEESFKHQRYAAGNALAFTDDRQAVRDAVVAAERILPTAGRAGEVSAKKTGGQVESEQK